MKLKKEHFGMFVRGFWDSVQFGYVPDFTDTEEQAAWFSGYKWGKDGNGEPSMEDFYLLCGPE